MKRKQLNRIRACGFVFLACTVFVATPSVASQDREWPTQPIRLIVPFGPGGGSDLVGRVLAQHLGEKLGQSVVVENRPGAGGSIGAAQVARAAPDGYMLLLGSSSEVVQYPAVNPKVTYQALRDFAPVSQVATVPLVLAVNSNTGVDTVQEFVEFAKSNSATANYGSAGVGSSTHLAMALLLLKLGVDMNHVPYKGSAAVVTDLLGGSLHAAMPTLSAILAYQQDDRLTLLAASTAEPHPLLPGKPGMAQAGVEDFDISLWTGILAPHGTPDVVVQTLNKTINEVLALPEVKQALEQQGAVATGGEADQFREAIERDSALWKDVVAEAGITLK